MSGTNSSFGAGQAGTSWGAIQYDGLNGGYNHGFQYKVTSIVLLAIASLAMTLRIYTRVFVIKNPGWDDWLACVAWVLTILLVAVIAIGMDHGIGKSALELTGKEIVTILKVTYWFVIIDTLTLMWATCSVLIRKWYLTFASILKVSALCLYSRMTPSRRSLLVIRIVGIVTLMHGIAALIPSIFVCKPISAFWDPLQYGLKCFHILEFDLFNTAFSVATEVVIDILPIPVIRKLQIPRRRKVLLYTLLAFSTIGLAAAVLKLVALVVWMKSSNIHQNFALVPFMSAVEACVFLISLSIPAIHPLVRKRLGPLLSRLQSFDITKLSSLFSSSASSTKQGTRSSKTRSTPRSISAQGLRPDAHKHGYSIEIYAGSVEENETSPSSRSSTLVPRSSNQSPTVPNFVAYPMATLRPTSSRTSISTEVTAETLEHPIRPNLFTHWEDTSSIHY